MVQSHRILILEDNPADAELAQYELEEAGLVFTAQVVMTEEDFVRKLQEFSPDLILSDYDLPKYNGALALAEARKRCPETPFILVTGAVSEDRAIEILTQGAKDYVLKNRLQQRLMPAVSRAFAEAEEHRARKQAEAELREAYKTLEQRVKIRTAELAAEMMARKQLQVELLESKSQESAHFIALRHQAEERLTSNNAVSGPSEAHAADTKKLLHELQVFQIELEIINEELRQSKYEAEALLAKYLDVYDFAPIGYFTLNADAIILQANLTGAQLLGLERSRLTGRPFRIHVAEQFYAVFNAFLSKTFAGESIEHCELMLSPRKGPPGRFVQLEARLSEDRKECHLVMIDITARKSAAEQAR